MSRAPEVDVVILTWNDADDAHRAINSALASTGVRVNVIVVDNASAASFSCDRPGVTVFRAPRNLGVGAGRNAGTRVGRAPFLCFLDSDACLAPDTLARLTAAVAETVDVALAAPVFAGQSPEVGAGRPPSPLRKVARGLGLTDRYASTVRPPYPARWEIAFAIGACQLVRREAFDVVGGIDESHRFGPEDVDFCLRLTEAGWRLVQVRDAVCHHQARRSSRRLLTRNGLAHLRAVIRHYRLRPTGAATRSAERV